MTNISLKFLLVFAAAFHAAAAFAQSDNPCATQANTIDINGCAEQKYDVKDRELNQAYKALIAQLDGYHDNGPATKKALILAQRKWLEFRDADCSARSLVYQGGSIAASVYMECKIAHTDQRIKELQLNLWAAG